MEYYSFIKKNVATGWKWRILCLLIQLGIEISTTCSCSFVEAKRVNSIRAENRIVVIRSKER